MLRSALMVGLAWALASPGPSLGLTWDGTNPGATVCGDTSHTIYTLGKRTSASKLGNQGLPTPIYAGTTKIGEVEIRHSPTARLFGRE